MSDNDLRNWFLGPRGENSPRLQELTRLVVDRAGRWRYAEGGPLSVTPPNEDPLKRRIEQLLDYLQQRTVPAYSSRYQAHMGWDLLMPGVIGQLVGMLFPSNNVAYEGSPGTTVLEMLVARDLCRMLGYPETEQIKPWGHLVGGGTIGNIEGLWAARNLKFLPLALRATIAQEPFKAAENLIVTLSPTQEIELKELSSWQLLNVPIDESLALPARAASLLERHVIGAFEVELNKQCVNHRGLHAFLNDEVKAPKVVLSHDNHYSLEKAAALLGLGQDSLELIPVDEFGRMNVHALAEALARCELDNVPILAVVANLGSTELGAVDDLGTILASRKPFELDFMVHVDAAFGGYHASLLREDFDLDWATNGAAPSRDPARPPIARFNDGVREIGLSEHVERQYRVLHEADSIAVDPHKLGFMPYPGGAICYRNSALRDLTKYSAPYLGAFVPQGIGQIEERTDQFMGVFGVEGSRSGGAAAAVFLAHSLLRPSKSGYGRLSGKELFVSKRVFAVLLSLNAGQNFGVAVAGEYPKQGQEQQLRDIAGKTDSAMTAADLKLLQACGPDLNLLCYAFNFKRDGNWNQDLLWLNVFNMLIYDCVELQPEPNPAAAAKQDLIVSRTVFAGREGTAFIERMLERLGVTKHAVKGEDELFALRSAEWNPWLTEQQGNLDTFKDALSSAVEWALQIVLKNMDEYKLAVSQMPAIGDMAIATGVANALAAKAKAKTKDPSWSGKPSPAQIMAGLALFQQKLAVPGLPQKALKHFP